MSEDKKWTVKYDNDTGPDDEGFSQWWTVTDGDRRFRCVSEPDSLWLLTFLNSSINPPQWTKNLPTESGSYWWWNGDEDLNPIHIELGISLPHRQVFAQIDQYGWNRAQNVEDMGGWWMELPPPKPPE